MWTSGHSFPVGAESQQHHHPLSPPPPNPSGSRSAFRPQDVDLTIHREAGARSQTSPPPLLVHRIYWGRRGEHRRSHLNTWHDGQTGWRCPPPQRFMGNGAVLTGFVWEEACGAANKNAKTVRNIIPSSEGGGEKCRIHPEIKQWEMGGETMRNKLRGDARHYSNVNSFGGSGRRMTWGDLPRGLQIVSQ